MEIKQRSQATTIENLKLETGWEFAVLLIKKKSVFDIGKNGSLFEGNLLALDRFC